MHRWKFSALLTLSLILAGCTGPEAEDLVKTYASRTGNAIDIDFDLNLIPTVAFYPRLADRRDRLAAVPEQNQSLLELLELRHCNLVTLVSERNTSLGKLAPESQRLIYELQFLPALTSCIEILEDKDEFSELKERLSEIETLKRKGFPAQLFNSFYNAPEMEQQFSLGEPPVSPNPELLDTGAIQPLERFKILAELVSKPSWDTPEFAPQLEDSYEQLYRSNFGGQWLASFALLTQTLDQTAQAIEQRLAGRPMCFNQRGNSKSAILWNVFNKFYIGSLQPYLALVERQAKRWQRLHFAILTSLSEQVVQTQNYLPYFSEQGPVWKNYLSARNRHTQAWQALLDQCGLRPGNPPS